MTSPFRRSLAASVTAVALIGVSACGAGTTTPTTSSSGSSGSASQGGGPGGSGPGGALQTFTAVDLDTDGANAAGANTSEVVAATTAFLGTLDAATADKVTFDFTDNQSRQTWSNYPATQVPRKGVALSDLSDASKTAALAVVKTMLSAQGFAQVQTIQQADDWLKANSSSGNDSFGSDSDYYIAVYGTPSATEPFMVQFGGHHWPATTPTRGRRSASPRTSPAPSRSRSRSAPPTSSR